MDNPEIKEEEKKFLQKVKDNLTTIKSGVDLLNLVLSTAKTFGIDLSRLAEMFQ